MYTHAYVQLHALHVYVCPYIYIYTYLHKCTYACLLFLFCLFILIHTLCTCLHISLHRITNCWPLMRLVCTRAMYSEACVSINHLQPLLQQAAFSGRKTQIHFRSLDTWLSGLLCPLLSFCLACSRSSPNVFCSATFKGLVFLATCTRTVLLVEAKAFTHMKSPLRYLPSMVNILGCSWYQLSAFVGIPDFYVQFKACCCKDCSRSLCSTPHANRGTSGNGRTSFARIRTYSHLQASHRRQASASQSQRARRALESSGLHLL